jgi:hypothetical protein
MKKIIALFSSSFLLFSAAGLSLTSAAFADVHVNGYYRSNGTYVQPYYRSDPDGNPYNNYSYPGNTNPYTGETATGNPDTYLEDNDPSYVAPATAVASTPTPSTTPSIATDDTAQLQQEINQLEALLAQLEAKINAQNK